DDPVRRLLGLAHPHQADLHGHVAEFLSVGSQAPVDTAGRTRLATQGPGTGSRGILPLLIDRIICWTILNCLSIPLTSCVLVPLPRESRRRREPLMIVGLRRSSGVMDRMIASIRPSCDSST